jgi:endonuclease/exonuclease/phosphatase family metal-dependent hydrolase
MMKWVGPTLFAWLIRNPISTPGGRIVVRRAPRTWGWRLDYQAVTPGLRDKVVSAEIYTAENFSDHAPVIIDYAV